jgi:uncharacterized protein YjbI with pentapeptide repeats
MEGVKIQGCSFKNVEWTTCDLTKIKLNKSSGHLILTDCDLSEAQVTELGSSMKLELNDCIGLDTARFDGPVIVDGKNRDKT